MSPADKDVFVWWAKSAVGLALIILSSKLCNYFGYDGLVGNAIMELPWLYCFAGWIGLELLFGKLEGYFDIYKVRANINTGWDEHVLLTGIRLLVLFLIIRLLHNVWQPVFLWATFPFVHDGMIYFTRNKIDTALGIVPPVYPKTWLDHSTTSTAVWEKFMTAPVRIALLVVGILGYFGYQYLIYKGIV